MSCHYALSSTDSNYPQVSFSIQGSANDSSYTTLKTISRSSVGTSSGDWTIDITDYKYLKFTEPGYQGQIILTNCTFS